MFNDKTKAIAEGLTAAIAANDPAAIGAGVSALSMSLGGMELVDQPWSASMQTLYLLCLVVAAQPGRTEGNVVNLHGLPLSAG